MNNNWSLIPKITIQGAGLATPSTICAILTHYKIDKYIYQIIFNNVVIKYGMSADNSRNYGERLYRQIGHSASWSKPIRINGSSGAEWRIIEEDFKNKYGYAVNIQACEISVWDLSNYPFTTINSREEILCMEAELIDNHVQSTGEKPIGNINDEAWYIEKKYIKKETLKNLFDNYESMVR